MRNGASQPGAVTITCSAEVQAYFESKPEIESQILLGCESYAATAEPIPHRPGESFLYICVHMQREDSKWHLVCLRDTPADQGPQRVVTLVARLDTRQFTRDSWPHTLDEMHILLGAYHRQGGLDPANPSLGQHRDDRSLGRRYERIAERLVRRGLLTKDPASKIYKPTEVGQAVAHAYWPSLPERLAITQLARMSGFRVGEYQQPSAEDNQNLAVITRNFSVDVLRDRLYAMGFLDWRSQRE